MTYKLKFVPSALKEWKKLSAPVKSQFKKKLEERLINPRVPSAKLGGYSSVYKIKLRSAGYRLVYEVVDGELGFVRKVGSQATADARHAYHRLKATCQLFIACGDAATFFKPTKAAFYRIPLPIFGFVEPPG